MPNTSVLGSTPDRADPAQRIEIIDALRGFALLGILQVNIQSFTWGTGEPLGYLAQPPGAAESALYFFQAAFLEGKFYPIFAFLFGVGVTLQLRKLRRQRYDKTGASAGTDRAAAGVAAVAAHRRRLLILLALGIVHGLLLYCGDVLSAYAICALVFVAVAPVRPRELVLFTASCWAAAVLSLFVPIGLAAFFGPSEAPQQIPQSVLYAHSVYSEGGFVAQIRQRWFDELWQQVGGIATFWPQVFALLSLGSLAGRLGWLRHPDRHPVVWRRARLLGLGIGLPCALIGAWMSLVRARTAPGTDGGWDSVVLGVSSLLAAAYVAAALSALRRPWGRTLAGWLACAGRLSLTNYILQSLAMSALLSGWGMGLGAGAGRAQLAALALILFVAQLVLSRWILAHFRQGPLEALWRRWTYRPSDGGSAC